MASPLANLAKALPDNKYIYTSEAFSGEKLDLMKAKGAILMIIWILSKNSLKRNNRIITEFRQNPAFGAQNLRQISKLRVTKSKNLHQ